MKKCAIMLILAMLAFAGSASAQMIYDTFYITIGPNGEIVDGGGSGWEGGMWYTYPSGFINQWYNDYHEFDPERGKIFHIEFDWMALDPGLKTNISVTINWSTEKWYDATDAPLPGVDEEDYIGRAGFFAEIGMFPQMQHYAGDFTIWPYNPQWVSIGVRGYNFVIMNGELYHDCVLGTEESSWGEIKAKF